MRLENMILGQVKIGECSATCGVQKWDRWSGSISPLSHAVLHESPELEFNLCLKLVLEKLFGGVAPLTKE